MPNFLSGTFFLFSQQVPVGLTRNLVATVDERVHERGRLFEVPTLLGQH